MLFFTCRKLLYIYIYKKKTKVLAFTEYTQQRWDVQMALPSPLQRTKVRKQILSKQNEAHQVAVTWGNPTTTKETFRRHWETLAQVNVCSAVATIRIKGVKVV